MLLLLLLFVLYVVSCIGTYYYIRIAFSYNGRWPSLKPGFAEVLIMFCPFVNTVFALQYLGGACYKDKPDGSDNDYSKFFGVTKSELPPMYDNRGQPKP